ncbi:serine/threonine-protein kinase [Nocardia sp. NPDC057668]|uniref:serine/threonine-protein kinase n=1 Tax=Nocardia sp. NPDC057668 TaxID=3346202 RepID=UPI00366DF954
MKARGRNIPKQLGRYRVHAMIGHGAMGEVLLGRSPDGRPVAIKLIHGELADDDTFQARFRREIEASERVTGAYTAGIVDHDIESERPWLATEFIPGPTLQEVLDRHGRLSLSGLKLLAIGLASALVEIHRAGLVHRDLKPGNVLLTAEGPRVIDFGIALALESDAPLTIAGARIGSPAYMSPEQAAGLTLTQASDVFALGAVLVTAATGVIPFGTAGPLHGRAELGGVPVEIRGLIDACLAADPARRPTPAQLLDAAESVPGDPVWPGPIRRTIEEFRAEAVRWAEQPAPEDAKPLWRGASRRARALIAAAALGAVVLTASLLADVTVPGHAIAMGDPPVALTDLEARTLDVCALLEQRVMHQFGSYVAELQPDGVMSCSTALTDADKRKTTYTLGLATPAARIRAEQPTTGKTVAWMPLLGPPAPAARCDRYVVTQSGLPLAVGMRAEVATGDACPAAESALRAVIGRLAVNPPVRALSGPSLLGLDPCALFEDGPIPAGIGDPAAPLVSGPHGCRLSGRDGDFAITFDDRLRPAWSGARTLGFRSVDSRKAWTVERAPGRCSYVVMIQPSAGKNAEIAAIDYTARRPSDRDACDIADAVAIPILKKLPRL